MISGPDCCRAERVVVGAAIALARKAERMAKDCIVLLVLFLVSSVDGRC